MRICILTIGTLGDVQPYIALGLGLQAAGHTIVIATLVEFEMQILAYGLEFAHIRGDFLKAAQGTPGDPGTQGTKNPLRLIREYVAMAADTLRDEWASARDAEVFIYNPAAIGGYHIAEKLRVPTFAAFPAPLYSPTRAFPSPFFPFPSLGPFNKGSHHLFAKMGPGLYKGAINTFRKEVLGLPPAAGEALLFGKPVAKLYGYSEVVVPRPPDWDASTAVTGYCFLDAAADWAPDPGLAAFLQAGPPPVYVGFGSMFMNGGAKKTEIVLRALEIAGQRGILAAGWGGLTAENAPEGVYVLPSIPHDWLFPQVAAVVHHGGAGTTGAGLRAGKPTVICPFVGDQFFWGRRVAALGAGPPPIPQFRLTPARLGNAIRQAVADPAVRAQAAALGTAIRAEDGVARAVERIHAQLSQ